MNTNIFRLLVVMLATTALSTAVKADPNAVLDRDFGTFLEWFPGRYDNQEQYYFERRLERPEDELHERIHHIFVPVSLPAFGEHVFYVQQYMDDDPSNVYRQRIYVFETDYEANAIRLTIHIPNDTDAVLDAHQDVSKLDGLTPDATRTLPGCDVFWRRQANQFIGSMIEGDCRYYSERSGRTMVIYDDLVLTDSEIWIRDRAEDEDGNYVFGNKAGIPHKNLKARRFECWAGVTKKDGEGMDFWSGIEVWDQGSKVWMETEEDEPQSLGLQIRNVRWPTGNNRDSMVLYAWRKGEDSAVSYVWSSPDSERLAMNLRWMQASCTLTPTAATTPISPD